MCKNKSSVHNASSCGGNGSILLNEGAKVSELFKGIVTSLIKSAEYSASIWNIIPRTYLLRALFLEV